MRQHVPLNISLAYDWVAAAGEIPALTAMTEDEAELYAEQAAANAQSHDLPLNALEIERLAKWLRS